MQQYRHQLLSFVAQTSGITPCVHMPVPWTFVSKWAYSVYQCFQQLHVLLLCTSDLTNLQLVHHLMTLTSILYYVML